MIASLHAKACRKIARNVRNGSKQGLDSACWSFDSKKTRAGKVVGTIFFEGYIIKYVHHSNGILRINHETVTSREHAARVFLTVMQAIDPGIKRGRSKRIGKKHRARMARATRKALGLKPGQSALHPEFN